LRDVILEDWRKGFCEEDNGKSLLVWPEEQDIPFSVTYIEKNLVFLRWTRAENNFRRIKRNVMMKCDVSSSCNVTIKSVPNEQSNRVP
jgi:hypothetical protein